MVVNCEIKFVDNPHGIYFAGQTLSGIVELTIDKPKKIRGLILKIEGFAKVQWTETEHNHHHGHGHGNNNHGPNHSKTKTVHYTGREDYLSTISYLIGSAEGNQIEILPGIHSYNFTTVLPALLPTSFEAKFGSIRYLVNVILDRPWKFDLTYKVAFTVLKQLDLNYENPALRIPSKMEVIKTFYCGVCQTAPLYMSASIPFSGYVAGQNVHISIHLNNESRIDVEDIKISLKKIIFYNSQTPQRKTKEEIVNVAELRCGAVIRRSKGTYEQKLTIPPIPPSNLNYCRVLNVSYEIHVVAKIAGIHKNPVIKLPITIGTVPLSVTVYHAAQSDTSFAVQYPSAPVQTPSPMGNISLTNALAHGNGSAQTSRTSDLLPPSYIEAMGSSIQLNEDGEHSMGSKPFNPLYPVYNFGSTNQINHIPSIAVPSSETSTAPGSISESGIIHKY